MAIGKADVCVREHPSHAGAVDAARFYEHVFDLAAMSACVHAKRPADRAGHAAQEGEAVDAGLGGGLRHALVRRGRAGDDLALGRELDRAEGSPAKADDDPFNAAIPHDEV